MLPKQIFLPFALLVLLLPSQAYGWVLCYENDGRVALERGLWGSCDPSEVASEVSLVQLQDSHCGSCADEELFFAQADRARIESSEAVVQVLASPIFMTRGDAFLAFDEPWDVPSPIWSIGNFVQDLSVVLRI